MVSHEPYRHVALIQQCASNICHNAPFWNKMCTRFLLQSGELWDICLMYFEICAMGLLQWWDKHNRRMGVSLLPWRRRILCILAGQGIRAETCRLDYVFPPDDPGFGLYTQVIIIYRPGIVAAFYVIEITLYKRHLHTKSWGGHDGVSNDTI